MRRGFDLEEIAEAEVKADCSSTLPLVSLEIPPEGNTLVELGSWPAGGRWVHGAGGWAEGTGHRGTI